MLRLWLVSPRENCRAKCRDFVPLWSWRVEKLAARFVFSRKGFEKKLQVGWTVCISKTHKRINRYLRVIYCDRRFFLFEDGEEGLDCFQKKKFNIEAIISYQWCLWCAWALKRIKRLEGETKLRETGVHRGNKYSITMIVCGKKLFSFNNSVQKVRRR